MTRKLNVAQFHADYDIHKDHRIHLFGAVMKLIEPRLVLYPGSYVDIAPSVFFDNVHYVDTDKRAARFFGQERDVIQLIEKKRAVLDRPVEGVGVRFEQTDYRNPLDLEERSVDLLVSLYAGFISEHCYKYVAPGGHLFVNNSHGDASMATLHCGFQLTAVVSSRSGKYLASTKNLDDYFIPKSGNQPTVESLHASGRGVAYTKQAYAYLFRRTSV